MDKACTCCFTGHRELNPDKGLPLALATLNTIYDALIDGYTQFITGLAEGADMMFAKDVIFLRQRHPEIKLFAAISHEGRLKSKDEEFQELLSYCDKYYLISLFYHGGVYSARNKWIVLCEASHNSIYEKQMVMQSNRIKVAYNNLFCADDFTLP